jgi:hypothetical protein
MLLQFFDNIIARIKDYIVVDFIQELICLLGIHLLDIVFSSKFVNNKYQFFFRIDRYLLDWL